MSYAASSSYTCDTYGRTGDMGMSQDISIFVTGHTRINAARRFYKLLYLQGKGHVKLQGSGNAASSSKDFGIEVYPTNKGLAFANQAGGCDVTLEVLLKMTVQKG